MLVTTTAAATATTYRKPRAIGYIVRHADGYPNDPSAYTYCATRDDVHAELIDLGYLVNPAALVYRMTKGDTPSDVIASLVASDDPYPDYYVSRGPRGGYVWDVC